MGCGGCGNSKPGRVIRSDRPQLAKVTTRVHRPMNVRKETVPVNSPDKHRI